MIIADFTQPEIDFLLEKCNFVNLEKPLFEKRANGMTLMEIADELNISQDYAKKLSQKVNKKIIRIL